MASKTEDMKPRIGFIGIGNMGSRMSSRLIESGYAVTVYDRSAKNMQILAKRGATMVDSPRRLAAECDIVMSSVSDDAAVEAVMFGPEGAIAGARDKTIFIDLSTVHPSTSRKIFESARAKGASMLDATVSGSTPQAEQGSLVVMVGGEKQVFEQCKPILSVLGKEVIYVGPSGSGTAIKLVVNTLLGVGLQALAEAIALGEKAGLNRDTLLDLLGQTAVISPAHKMKIENVRQQKFPATFPVKLMHKDFGLIMRLATELSVPMPATAAAQQMCAAQNAIGLEEDYSSTIRLMEELSCIPATACWQKNTN
ncbi:MAG TPA: NAD(P)-dependent oxidoreductase [Thermodesulfovibrionales bacterium]|nr:NAD(P)-dependent oxidoreductase [Thermodesulfovibrionales bacterium]